MKFLKTARRSVAVLLCASGVFGSAAHAMERVTLRTGFTVDCSRHEVVGSHVRLYTGVGSDYQELSMLQVANIEFLPDPPKPILLPKPSALAVASSTLVARAVAAEVDVKDLLVHAGAEHNIDVELLASIIHAESGYKVKAVSRAGARGLMQLMPSTARTFGARDALKADQNIAAGTAFLDQMLKRYNDNLALALAAYNAGPGAVERYHGVPPFRETRTYVTKVINEFYRRKLAMGAIPASAASATPAAAEQALPVKAVESASLKLASAPIPLP